ncbi:hypothetical protein M8818_002943 [Zalaria obscura]|uniref:Uncharacterized protein n=1 Tax=Zalaria obscura TaxID=2024903 RepID=A0ACC3SG34_9PEZI
MREQAEAKDDSRARLGRFRRSENPGKGCRSRPPSFQNFLRQIHSLTETPSQLRSYCSSIASEAPDSLTLLQYTLNKNRTMSEEPRKRSRFDQTEPEPRRSRFDQRSRSPSTRNSEPRRSRSPARDTESPSQRDPGAAAAAAAAAAAKINAAIQAKKGIQHVDVPPIRSTQSPSGGAARSPSTDTNGGLNKDIYTQDGDYIKDLEVNDLRNRYTLTKGSTQKMIKEKTGADVTTRGSYYPDKSMATAANPPLYLHITSTSREGLEKAVQEIEQLMQQELPNLVDERRFRRRDQPEQQVERDHLGRRKWPEEKIPVDLEPIPGFNLRAQVVGQGGSYVKHIQQETRCRVQIKGRGSGFMEHDTGRESDEQMYLHVAGPDPNEVQKAKELCLDLLANVRQQYEAFKERGPRGGGDRDHGERGHGRGGYGGGGYGRGGGDHHRGSYDSGNYGGHGGYGGAQSPAVSAAAASAMSPAQGTPDYSQAYAQYYANGQDPYAAYGGYEAYCKAYMEYYQQYQASGAVAAQSPVAGQAPGQQAAYGQSAAAPPPPPSNEAPPPPPSSNSAPPPPPGASGGYNSVPPPPGMAVSPGADVVRYGSPTPVPQTSHVGSFADRGQSV